MERQLTGTIAENFTVLKAVDLERSLPLLGCPCSEKPNLSTLILDLVLELYSASWLGEMLLEVLHDPVCCGLSLLLWQIGVLLTLEL